MDKTELILVLESIMDVLKSTLSANHEVVLHDLKRPKHSVHKIINGHVSGRQVNAPLLKGPEQDQGFIGLIRQPDPDKCSHLITDYHATTSQGKTLQSASLIFYDTAGNPDVAFCINVDKEPQELLERLQMLLYPSENGLDSTLSDTLHAEQASDAVKAVIERYKIPGQKIKKEQRRLIVAEAYEHGIFKLRGGVVMMAEALGVTRFTIYNDLEVLNIKQ